jgi:holliday junction DNA helicase RuvA
MLGSLTGTVTAHLDNRILIEVNGVGYWVHTGSWRPATSEITCAYLYHAIREDASDLYGFASIAQLQLFEQLISISGVGPKAGLSILSLGEPERIAQAIVSEDSGFLSMASGIGKKAAEKIILELKNKLSEWVIPGTTSPAPIHDELMESLMALGYKQHEIRVMVSTMPDTLTTIEAQLRWVLSNKA